MAVRKRRVPRRYRSPAIGTKNGHGCYNTAKRDYNGIKSNKGGAPCSFPNLPLRVNHNDTKLNNIILDGAKWMVIDLDTVMKGYVMFDFGDMVRTFTSPAFEDEKDLSKTEFRFAHFEALTKGYLKPLNQALTETEKESLLDGAFYIIYEQVLRFLTDFLKANVYYKVAYPDHNLVRTRTQLKLLKSIIEKESELRTIIEKYT